jgi:nitrite reductase/ring-hydroxylating ferredoxin subunit
MTALCAAADVRTGHPILARQSPTASVIVLRLADGNLVAYRNVCPHMGIELDWDPARLLTRNGRYLQCTGHGALFEPSNGNCMIGPCAGERLTCLPIRIESEMVTLDD